MNKLASIIVLAIGLGAGANSGGTRIYKPLKKRTSNRNNKPTNRRKKVKLARKANRRHK